MFIENGVANTIISCQHKDYKQNIGVSVGAHPTEPAKVLLSCIRTGPSINDSEPTRKDIEVSELFLDRDATLKLIHGLVNALEALAIHEHPKLGS